MCYFYLFTFSLGEIRLYRTLIQHLLPLPKHRAPLQGEKYLLCDCGGVAIAWPDCHTAMPFPSARQREIKLRELVDQEKDMKIVLPWAKQTS